LGSDDEDDSDYEGGGGIRSRSRIERLEIGQGRADSDHVQF
jgi:hypothetical protein